MTQIKINISSPFERPTVDPLTTPPKYEEVFSPARYFGIALIVGVLAAATIPYCFPAAIALGVIASWYLLSAAICVLNRLSESTHIHHLHALAMEANAVVMAAAAFPFTFFQKCLGPYGDAKGRPILLVNGYMSFGSTWFYQRKKLMEAGFGPIYSMNVGSFQSIDTYTEEVKEKALEIRKETGRNDLILIGHSKGGLISSRFATHLADSIQAEVTDVITIGSPLSGTPLAHFGPGLDAFEMRPSSKFHQELREKMKGHSTHFYHIASEKDAVVPISSALFGEDPQNQFVLKDMGHLGLVYSSRVANQIRNWLEQKT